MSGCSTSPPRWPASAWTGAASASPRPPTRPEPSSPTRSRWSARGRRPRPPAYDKIKRRARGMPRGGVIDPDYFKDRRGHQLPPLPHPGHAVLDPHGRAARQRPPGGPRAQHRAGAPRRRDREPDDAAPRPAVRAGHLRGRLRRVQLQDHLPPLRRGSPTGRGPSAQVLVDTQEERPVRPRRRRRRPRPSGEPMLFFHAWTCPELGGNCPGGHNYDRDNALRRAPLAVRRRAAVHQPPVAADRVVRRADPAAASAADADADTDADGPTATVPVTEAALDRAGHGPVTRPVIRPPTGFSRREARWLSSDAVAAEPRPRAPSEGCVRRRRGSPSSPPSGSSGM